MDTNNRSVLASQEIPTGRLTVVGAGPGDPDLITLKAIKVLGVADIVLYDALVNEVLLDYATQAELLFVGKRKGCYAYQQEEINQMILDHALEGKHVVRLKGGDPLVFGRGAEEIDYVAPHGVSTYIVPGITSPIAVPAYQGVPLTKRGFSESFWVITGTTKSHQLSKDVAEAAKSNATVVILMGMSKLSEIVQIFKQLGKAETPILITQHGTRAQEKSVVATIDAIEAAVSRNNLGAPSIIVIGEVAHQASQFSKEDAFWKALSEQVIIPKITSTQI